MEFLNQLGGMGICISDAIEQPESGVVIWSITNQNREHEEVLGFLIPALDWGLCSAYEATAFSPHTAVPPLNFATAAANLVIFHDHVLNFNLTLETVADCICEEKTSPDFAKSLVLVHGDRVLLRGPTTPYNLVSIPSTVILHCGLARERMTKHKEKGWSGFWNFFI
ncbi:hypothetical protein B0H19DRAFT_1056011 [Mycena capillaripes]|nr:hypothetical protein B0H19DRAFT_1056011 [Mycena capillaripes]